MAGIGIQQETEHQPGDEIIFSGTKYTLIEKAGNFGWIACETANPNAKPKIILAMYLSSKQNGDVAESEPAGLHCTLCGSPIEPHTKYIALWETYCGFRVEVGCAHHTPAGLDRAEAIVNSSACFDKLMEEWQETLKTCDH